MASSPDLLARFPGDQPGGVDLRYDQVYADIKEARREEIDAPQGDWKRARKVADWALVAKLATDALASRSKDLQIAVWLTEAMVWRDGLPGLGKGCELLRGLLLEHWDHLFPRIDDGDTGLRSGPLEWLGLKLDVAVKSIPLTRDRFSYLDYLGSRALGHEAAVGEDFEKQKAWKKAMEEGRLSADTFDASVLATPKPFYKTLVAGLKAAREAVRALEQASDQRFPDEAPAYTGLLKALDEVGHVAGQLLARKLELEPDPVEAVVESAGTADPGEGGAAADAPVTLEPVDRPDAAARVVVIARFLRRLDPTDPTPYLMLRALRWGELRAGGSVPDPRLLQPPPTVARVQLRGLFLDSKWPELLEAGETIMGTPAGRGWLDLQRYAIQACQQLGDDYGRVTRAIRSELRALLEDIPGIPEMTMMDDMPVATPETRSWLTEAFGTERAAAATEGTEPVVPARAPVQEAAPGDRMHARALSEVRAGRPQRGIELLMGELDRETSPRGRFLRQAQVTRIMVDHGLEGVAQPILEEMLKAIEEHKLEEWEIASVVSQPLALMYRCLEKTSGDADERQRLYLRICRLDPLTALDFSRSS
jgi:type VI secretion system protein ImpA